MKYQREALLREPIELVSAYIYFILAVVIIVASEVVFLIPSVAIALAVIFVVRGAIRFQEGIKIKRYQKNLIFLKPYQLSSKNLPMPKGKTFIGMGFEFTGKHAQRLHEVELPKNAKYSQTPKLYKWARQFEDSHQGKTWAKLITIFTMWKSSLNPIAPRFELGGKGYLHGVGLYEKEEPITITEDSRNGHTLILGTTGVGKTRLAELLITQDIHAGHVVIIVDPKGDAELLTRTYIEAKRAGREDDFYMFHLGFPEQSAQYNPVGQFMRVTEVASRIANQMPSSGQSAAFKEFVWGYANQISKGIIGIGQTPSFPLIKTYADHLEPLYIEFMTTVFGKYAGEERFNSEIAALQEIVNMKAEDRRKAGLTMDIGRISRDKEAIAYYVYFMQNQQNFPLTSHELDIGLSLTKAFVTDQQYLSKLVSSLGPFLSKMTTGAVSDLIAPTFSDPSKQTFDWASIIQSGGIVYVGLDALSDAEVARTVGNSMLADLTSIYGRIYKEGVDYGLPELPGRKTPKRKICLHFDEVNETAGIELIPTLNKARGAGVQFTGYTQTSSDFEARLGNKAFAKQLFGNFNTVIMMRVQDEDTAKILTNKQPEVTVQDMLVFSGATENSDVGASEKFSSSTQSRMTNEKRKLLEEGDLMKLPTGQGFLLAKGNILYKFRTPLLKEENAKSLPKDIREVATQMAENYTSGANDWDSYKENFDPVSVLNKNASEDVYSNFTEQLQEQEKLFEPWSEVTA